MIVGGEGPFLTNICVRRTLSRSHFVPTPCDATTLMRSLIASITGSIAHLSPRNNEQPRVLRKVFGAFTATYHRCTYLQ
jgi:hypothetical protein